MFVSGNSRSLNESFVVYDSKKMIGDFLISHYSGFNPSGLAGQNRTPSLVDGDHTPRSGEFNQCRFYVNQSAV